MKPVLFIFMLLYSLSEVFSIDPLVLTSHGLVLGVRASDGDYSKFLGIPYAKVDPNNPFGAPLDSGPFEDVYRAFDDSAVCPQRDLNSDIIGKLDCLHVNLYVPRLATSRNLLPVMIWIHGGAYNSGNSNRQLYGPKFIVQHNVLLVTFNYRLNIYGFLSLNTTDVPGNAGLRDQLAALKWIRQNIVAFGGDPNNITLFGESAGASSVEFHMLSGLSDGLFHKVIMQSGTVLSDWVMAEPLKGALQIVAGHMGLHTNDDAVALEFLSNEDPHDVVKAVIELNLNFKPCVEHRFDEFEPIISDSPSKLLQSHSYKDVPILSGFNNVEGLASYHYYEQSEDYFEVAGLSFEAKVDGYLNLSEEEKDLASKYVQDFYLGDSKNIRNSVYEMIDFNSDFTYIYPIRHSTTYHLNRNSNQIYQYTFSYSGHRNLIKQMLNITVDGASHGDELGYLFDSNYMTFPDDIHDELLIRRLTTMWTNFAKYSNPTPSVSDLIPIIWEPSDKNSRRFLIIDKELQMSYHPYHQRMAFWDLFFKLYEDKLKW